MLDSVLYVLREKGYECGSLQQNAGPGELVFARRCSPIVRNDEKFLDFERIFDEICHSFDTTPKKGFC